jgi:hypothetical protein
MPTTHNAAWVTSLIEGTAAAARGSLTVTKVAIRATKQTTPIQIALTATRVTRRSAASRGERG